MDGQNKYYKNGYTTRSNIQIQWNLIKFLVFYTETDTKDPEEPKQSCAKRTMLQVSQTWFQTALKNHSKKKIVKYFHKHT
jgi:hypothetical protein